ncbi:gametocyte-specific factor 1 [Cygnus olor]|uniref:gametocyte-specific factor 1 n=1 Tax=Cygnus olor TaxID=8869 RepID=UPI001ADE7606|nr:gametocyte-specific factor 1 [Cygnus olor]
MEAAPEPEALVQCPYDRSHRVRAARLPYHLVKCQRNNPQVARHLATCPFNARHRVPRAELRSHLASCPDRRQIDVPPEAAAAETKSPEAPAAWQSPPCREDWEAELDGLEDAPPFILTVTTGELLLPSDRCAPAAPQSRNRGTVPPPPPPRRGAGLRGTEEGGGGAGAAFVGRPPGAGAPQGGGGAVPAGEKVIATGWKCTFQVTPPAMCPQAPTAPPPARPRGPLPLTHPRAATAQKRTAETAPRDPKRLKRNDGEADTCPASDQRRFPSARAGSAPRAPRPPLLLAGPSRRRIFPSPGPRPTRARGVLLHAARKHHERSERPERRRQRPGTAPCSPRTKGASAEPPARWAPVTTRGDTRI